MIVQPAALEREIETEEAALGRNLEELEQHAKEFLDWRAYVRKNPRTMLGVAFGGGLLIAAMSGTRRPRSNGRTGREGDYEAYEGDEESSPGRDAWRTFKNALVGAAVTQAAEYLAELLPDFPGHLEAEEEAMERRRRSGAESGRNGQAKAGIEL